MPEVNVTTVTVGEYKGKPTISLPTDNPKFPVTFGLAKAKAILAHIDEIDAFVREHSTEETPL